MTSSELWDRFNRYLCRVPALDLTLDISRMDFDDAFLARMAGPMQGAFDDMQALEKGAIANPDEKRMVGHYWLRAPGLAPTEEIAAAIRKGVADVKSFAARVHSGEFAPERGGRFTEVLLVGIGGSALGPMFVADALGNPSDPMRVHFLDNTDPDGIARVLAGLEGKLQATLTVVVSKSGGTPETYNGMMRAAAAYKDAGLSFAAHAVAVTMPGSKLDKQATSEGWRERFPMFDWVGGRTSELSAVGLLPAALQGFDINAMLAGAADCDVATRVREPLRNPAALLALMWYHATGGAGKRDMVVLPYKDRLLLFSRYLQQLIMESLGKEKNLKGEIVHQGISVYGNKGSTDQHAYVQQLRDGVENFFVTFVRVLEEGGSSAQVNEGMTAGDFLHGFLLGTREALYAGGRQSMTLTIPRVDARRVGCLIALFERAVGFYASLIGINAYHQPGVEAGKKAAASVLDLERSLQTVLSEEPRTVAELTQAAGILDRIEAAYLILEHLAANGRARGVLEVGPAGATFSRA